MKRLLLASTLAGLSSLATRDARAIERQHHIGIAPTLGLLDVKEKSTLSLGGGGTAHYTYGLTDQFNLTVEGSSVFVAKQELDTPTTPRNRPAVVSNLSAGVGYVIDILQWVPYIGVQTGGYVLTGGTMPDPRFVWGASVQVGVDYQISREWAVGLGGRQHFLLTKLSTYPSYTTVLFRVEYMWGY